MGGKAFLDTNVLLRGVISTFPLHQEAKALIFEQRQNNVELWISRQVIREFLVQVTRPQPFVEPLRIEEVEAHLISFPTLFHIADENAEVTNHLLALLKQYPTGGKQVHDANIVATMLAYGIDTLLTQNISDMARFVDKVKILPLTTNSQTAE
jgi:predicted nucleic acid-binding protein